jgi:RIO kinase 1
MAKAHAKFKTYGNVFDAFTERNIFHLISQGHFERMQSPLSVGKEANVFTAVGKDKRVIVKIYRLETCDFNRMYDYIKGDPRYPGLKQNMRRIIFSWTQREFRNLLKAREANVSAPTPYTVLHNILLEEFIGREDAAPKLKDQKPADPEAFYELVVHQMQLLAKAGLVHGDLSAFNILNHNEKPVLIDFSQATTSKHANYPALLERDAKNIAIFFSKLKVKTSPEEILKRVSAAE